MLRTELGEYDRRTEHLAEDAGRHLGAAGERAFRRADMPATTSLLARATSLLAIDESGRRALLVDLGLTRHASGDADGAVEAMTEAIEASRAAGDRRVESWARIELEYVELQRQPKRTADGLLAAITAGMPVLEHAGDDRALGRALVLLGWICGGRQGKHAERMEATQRALEHFKQARWSTSTCLGEIAAALYWGPFPVDEAITHCQHLLRNEISDRAGSAYVTALLGGLVAQNGDFKGARELVESSRARLVDLGLHAAARGYSTHVLGDIALLAGDYTAAEQLLRELCKAMVQLGQSSRLASTASELADVLAISGAVREADEWTLVAERCMAPDDVHARVRWYPARARIHAERGELHAAEDSIREGARLCDTTDDLNRSAKTYHDLAYILGVAGKREEASATLQRAIELYEQKGNAVGASRLRSLHDEMALA
jgi:tetratricopeptide (TPR) repeat protein